MDLSTGKRKYRNLLADVEDQSLFFALFLLGTIGILSLKSLLFSQFTVTLFPLSLMFIYSIVALTTKRYRLREDRVGDNIYYLGFLYTLVSLGYALYSYQADGSGVDDILRNFGIAISTTILGLAGRVFFNQMREDPIEYEREARYSLVEATTSLRSQLADISTDVSSFKRKLVQIMEEGVVDIATSAKLSMTESVEHLAGTTNEAIRSIQTAFESFSEQSAQLNDAAEKTVTAVHALVNRIQQIDLSPELLAARFDPIVSRFEEIANEAMKRNRAQTNDLKRLRDMIDLNSDSSEKLRESFESLNIAATQKTQILIGWLDSTVGSLPTVTAELGLATTSLCKEIEAIQSLSAEILQGGTVHQRTVSEIRAAIELDLQAMQQHRRDMDALLTESRESLGALQGALVSLSKTLVEQLGGN